MAWYDIFLGRKYKRELAETKKRCAQQMGRAKQLLTQERQTNREMEAKLSIIENMEALGFRETVENLRAEQKRLQERVGELNAEVAEKETEIIQLDDAILLQSFGIYETRYDFEDSSLYKVRLDKIRDEQKQMVKNDGAVVVANTWSVGGSESEGKKMTKDYVKLILRSFNNECDATIVKAKYNNVESLEKKINKAAETLNKLGERMTASITSKYVNLKIQELYLSYEYELKKQTEKEEQRRIKEQMREEAKVAREIEEAKKTLRKEATHFTKAITKLDEQLETADSEEIRQSLEEEKRKIEEELAKVSEDIAANEMREKNTRAGHVYIISNIGSFGENVYKIGMTKRLDPQERVDELGDASVPYRFDVHALVFSEDAPALESAIHKAFSDRRINLVNQRREFFKVTLKEIVHVVKENFNKPVEFTMAAEAAEFRQSEQMRKVLRTGRKVAVS